MRWSSEVNRFASSRISREKYFSHGRRQAAQFAFSTILFLLKMLFARIIAWEIHQEQLHFFFVWILNFRVPKFGIQNVANSSLIGILGVQLKSFDLDVSTRALLDAKRTSLRDAVGNSE